MTTTRSCRWCGDDHGVDELCGRGQRAMTRRSFLFLTTSAVIAAAVAPAWPWQEYPSMVYHHAQPNIGQLVAEEWNRIIGTAPIDNIFDEPFKVLMERALTKRLKETS